MAQDRKQQRRSRGGGGEEEREERRQTPPPPLRLLEGSIKTGNYNPTHEAVVYSANLSKTIFLH